MKKLMLPTILSLNLISLAYTAQQMPSLPPMPSFPSSTQNTQPAQPAPQMPTPLPVSRPLQTPPIQPAKSVQDTIKKGALLVAESDTTLLKTADPEIKQWFASCQESLKKGGATIITLDDRLQKIRDSMRSIDQQIGTSILEGSAILGEVKDIYADMRKTPLTPTLTQIITAEETKIAQANQDITTIHTLKAQLTGIQNDVNKQQTMLLQKLNQARTATYALLTADKATAHMHHTTVVQIDQEIMRLQNEIMQKQFPSFESTAQQLNQKVSMLPSTMRSIQQQARQLEQQSKETPPAKEPVATGKDTAIPTRKETRKKRQKKKPTTNAPLAYLQEVATSAASLAFDCVQTTTSVVISMFEKPEKPNPEKKVFQGLFWKTLHVAHTITSTIFSTGASLAHSLYEKFLSTPQSKKGKKKKALSTSLPPEETPSQDVLQQSQPEQSQGETMPPTNAPQPPAPLPTPSEQPTPVIIEPLANPLKTSPSANVPHSTTQQSSPVTMEHNQLLSEASSMPSQSLTYTQTSQESIPIAQSVPTQAPVELKAESSQPEGFSDIEISSHDVAVQTP